MHRLTADSWVLKGPQSHRQFLMVSMLEAFKSLVLLHIHYYHLLLDKSSCSCCVSCYIVPIFEPLSFCTERINVLFLLHLAHPELWVRRGEAGLMVSFLSHTQTSSLAFFFIVLLHVCKPKGVYISIIWEPKTLNGPLHYRIYPC